MNCWKSNKKKILKDLVDLYHELWGKCKEAYLTEEHNGGTKLDSFENGFNLGTAFTYDEVCEELYKIIRKYGGRCFY